MPTDGTERRRASRRDPDPGEPLSRVRLRGGRELHVIDVSSLGVCIEGATRLLPGTHLDVHVTAAHGRVLVRARVVRCAVWGLTADEVRYRGALAFATLVDFPSHERVHAANPPQADAPEMLDARAV